ncbi:hypothetical protein AB0E59_21615 [Lentzea sp. NPDC034063]|uniref:hypothetical protein n=1 Tax=unclassified Lentzea TaxID=2643253 RepID=UPI0033D6FEAE
MGDVYLGEPARPRWLKAVQYLAVPAVAVVAGATLTVVQLVSRPQPITETPVAEASSVPAETGTTSPPAPAAGAQTPATMAGANRPVPSGSTPRTAGGTSVTAAPTTTSKAAVAAPLSTGVRFSGELRFGSFHLDPATPRDVPESNVWALTPTRLHGDPGYWLAEWHSDGVPGHQECVAHLAKNATLDADNVVMGSRVCGKSPEGRIFRIDVTVLDGSAITGQVTVWESS